MNERRSAVGDTGISVPPICFGTTAIGNMPGIYGYGVDEATAWATVRAILAPEDGFLDTSRNYGLGRSEERIGQVLRELGGWPEGRVLSTKLDRDMETLAFDGDRAWRSLEESLAALGVDHIHILHLHDPEHAADLSGITRKGGALDALMQMKAEGIVDAVGLAAGRVDVMTPLLRDWDFDAMITHNRYTLVNRNADAMIDLAVERGVAVFNAAPYAGGAFAKGAAAFGRYVYQEASAETLAPIARIEAICARHGVPPGAAALQFSLRDPRIASTICGVGKPGRIEETLAWADWPIPDEAWEEILAQPFATDDPEASRVYKPE